MPDAPEPRERPVRDAASFAAATGATPDQMSLVGRFQALLADWNQRMSLVGAASLEAFWPRHAFDSAQLIALAPEARTWIDIGAGAGFPGVVIAIFLKRREGAMVDLVESQAKKCRFLAAVVDELALPARVHNARAEALTLKGDVVTARAVAPLATLLGIAQPAMSLGAVGFFQKGAGAAAEIAEARKTWRFALESIPSRSDPTGRILKVSELRRAR